MAAFDRLREAVRPANTIEAVQPLEPQRRPVDLHGASPASPPEAAQAPAKKPANDPKSPAYTTEPEAIAKAYYVENRGGSERRYFDDYQRKALAIRADDTTINSKREDLTTIRNMLTIAEARGWSEVKVSGSADFKRETWIEASARGITAQGYKANDLDHQEADRRRSERGQGPARGPSVGNEISQVSASATASPTKAEAPAVKVPEPSIPSSAAKGEPAGKTVEVKAGAPAKAAPDAAAKVASPVQQQAKGESILHGEAAPSVDHRKALQVATAALSPDGRLMLGALSEKIDREMNKLNREAKAEMKAYVATELVKKEKVEGPVVLSADLKRAATAPEPAPQPKVATQPQEPAPRRDEPEEPRRTRGR